MLMAPVFIPAELTLVDLGLELTLRDVGLQHQYQGRASVFVEQILHNEYGIPLNVRA